MNNTETYKEKIFDDIKHLDELENEYLETREFMLVLNGGILTKQLIKIK